MKHQKYNIFPPIQSQMTHMHVLFRIFNGNLLYKKDIIKDCLPFISHFPDRQEIYTYLNFLFDLNAK